MSTSVSNLNGALTAKQVLTTLTVDATTTPVSDGDELSLVSAGQEVRGIKANGPTAIGQTSIPVHPFTLRAAVPDEASVQNRSKTSLTVDELTVTDKATEQTNAVIGNETVGGNETITGAETAGSNTP